MYYKTDFILRRDGEPKNWRKKSLSVPPVWILLVLPKMKQVRLERADSVDGLMTFLEQLQSEYYFMFVFRYAIHFKYVLPGPRPAQI